VVLITEMLEICIQTSYDQNVQLILKSYLPVVYGTPFSQLDQLLPIGHRAGVIYYQLFKYKQQHTADFTENNWVPHLLRQPWRQDIQYGNNIVLFCIKCTISSITTYYRIKLAYTYSISPIK
jgi:hypothetical protein